MMWSKLKKHIENNFAESLRGRVRLYTTAYGSDLDVRDLYNRGWIAVDGVEVVNFSTTSAFFLHGRDNNASTPGVWPASTRVKEYKARHPGLLAENGEFSKDDLTHSCAAFLELSVGDALAHPGPIVNMLAVLDRRMGKRRLVLLDSKELHPLVRYFLDLRLAAEGIVIRRP